MLDLTTASPIYKTAKSQPFIMAHPLHTFRVRPLLGFTIILSDFLIVSSSFFVAANISASLIYTF